MSPSAASGRIAPAAESGEWNTARSTFFNDPMMLLRVAGCLDLSTLVDMVPVARGLQSIFFYDLASRVVSSQELLLHWSLRPETQRVIRKVDMYFERIDPRWKGAVNRRGFTEVFTIQRCLQKKFKYTSRVDDVFSCVLRAMNQECPDWKIQKVTEFVLAEAGLDEWIELDQQVFASFSDSWVMSAECASMDVLRFGTLVAMVCFLTQERKVPSTEFAGGSSIRRRSNNTKCPRRR